VEPLALDDPQLAFPKSIEQPRQVEVVQADATRGHLAEGLHLALLEEGVMIVCIDALERSSDMLSGVGFGLVVFDGELGAVAQHARWQGG